jgi:predicted negative regulator of RcsB-dependent stress response
MTTLETGDSNIFDAETINWRLVVYPILAVAVVVVGGLLYFYYQQSQRDALEASARTALVAAKTPDEMAKVADQYPTADQSTLALLGASDAFFAKRDFPSAIQTYQRVIQSPTSAPELSDSAKIGLASAQEANGKVDDAITTYLEVAREGAKSPFAPFAYNSAALLYDQRGDKDNERKILAEAVSLDPDSAFVKQAQAKLKELTSTPMSVPVPASPAPAVAAPAPAAPAQK